MRVSASVDFEGVVFREGVILPDLKSILFDRES